jgi:DNA polymerase III sliding clamp (beta) subunit (PCNA family)
MKFQINRLQLLESLSKIAPVITKSTHNPLLSCVLIRIDSGTITFVGTDLGVTVVDSYPIDTDAKVDMCIDFQTLNDWINNTYDMNSNWIDATRKSDTKLQLRYAGGSLSIISKGSSSDFPLVSESNNIKPIATTNGLELADSIRRSIRIVNPKNIEGNLTLQSGVIVFDEDEIAVIASDGVSLAYNRVKADVRHKCELTLTHKAMNVVDGMLTKIGAVQIKQSDNHLLFQSGDTKVYSLMTKSEFPTQAVRHMVSMDHKNKVQIGGEAVVNALASFRGLVEQDSSRRKGIYIIFKPDTNQLIVQPEETIGGDGDKTLNARNTQGEEVRFVANYNAWGNCIRAIDGLDIIISYEEKQWVHITGTTNKQKYVIAPLIPR